MSSLSVTADSSTRAQWKKAMSGRPRSGGRPCKRSSFAAQSVAKAIGTQSVKVKLVRMCLCLVGTHESMFSCMNLSVFYWCVF